MAILKQHTLRSKRPASQVGRGKSYEGGLGAKQWPNSGEPSFVRLRSTHAQRSGSVSDAVADLRVGGRSRLARVLIEKLRRCACGSIVGKMAKVRWVVAACWIAHLHQSARKHRNHR